MKIGVVGTGFVGSTAAYALVMQGIVSDIVMVDYNPKRAVAEAADILHAVPFSYPAKINPGEYSNLAGCRAVIIAAGVNQKPGESRLQLLERNSAVFREVVPGILEYAPEAVLVVATNPVDVMTHLAAHYAAAFDIPSSKVIGSGTTLDTARFRSLLGSYLGVSSRHVHAYVIGEHGDSEVLTWSLATVAGMSLDEFCKLRKSKLDKSVRQEIDRAVRRAAYQIIEGKGATYYGIGAALARIVSVIINDQRAILTVSTPMADAAGVSNVTISYPHMLGSEGILDKFPLPLDEQEEAALRESAKVVKGAIDQLKTDES